MWPYYEKQVKLHTVLSRVLSSKSITLIQKAQLSSTVKIDAMILTLQKEDAKLLTTCLPTTWCFGCQAKHWNMCHGQIIEANHTITSHPHNLKPTAKRWDAKLLWRWIIQTTSRHKNTLQTDSGCHRDNDFTGDRWLINGAANKQLLSNNMCISVSEIPMNQVAHS